MTDYEAHVARVVAAAPPLTADQRRRLTALLVQPLPARAVPR